MEDQAWKIHHLLLLSSRFQHHRNFCLPEQCDWYQEILAFLTLKYPKTQPKIDKSNSSPLLWCCTSQILNAKWNKCIPWCWGVLSVLPLEGFSAMLAVGKKRKRMINLMLFREVLCLSLSNFLLYLKFYLLYIGSEVHGSLGKWNCW